MQSSREPKKSAGLKELRLWQAMLYPLLFMLVALYTWIKDRIVALFLPKRRFSTNDLAQVQPKALDEAICILVVDESSHYRRDGRGSRAG